MSGTSTFCLQSQIESEKVAEIVNKKVEVPVTKLCHCSIFYKHLCNLWSKDLMNIWWLNLVGWTELDQGLIRAGKFNTIFSYYWKIKYDNNLVTLPLSNPKPHAVRRRGKKRLSSSHNLSVRLDIYREWVIKSSFSPCVRSKRS